MSVEYRKNTLCTIVKSLNIQLVGMLQTKEDQAANEVPNIPPQVQENITGYINSGSNQTRNPTCADFDTLNGTVMAMISNVDLQNDMTNAILQNVSIRIFELETDRNEHNNVIHALTKDVSYLNETLMQVADEENYQNHSINENEKEMRLSYHARMTSLETNLMLTNATLAQLQTGQLNNEKMITNHTSRVMHLESSIEKLSSTAGLENRLLLLESDLNETKTGIDENNIMIQMLEMNDTIFRAFTDNQLQRNNEYETKLASILDAYIDYNETVGKIKVNT